MNLCWMGILRDYQNGKLGSLHRILVYFSFNEWSNIIVIIIFNKSFLFLRQRENEINCLPFCFKRVCFCINSIFNSFSLATLSLFHILFIFIQLFFTATSFSCSSLITKSEVKLPSPKTFVIIIKMRCVVRKRWCS